MAVSSFLQISDLHLGRPFSWLPSDKRAERRADQRRALELAVREAIERGVRAILLPGDLFDGESADADTVTFALSAFAVPGCPPVFITPGNHDPWTEKSPIWSASVLAARGWKWPECVHIFTSPNWSVKKIPGLEDVRVWGRACTSSGVSTDRPLQEGSIILPSSADAEGLDLALFHGSLEGSLPAGQKSTWPFSEKEIENSPFSYHAVGHYHMPVRHERKAASTTSTWNRGNSGVASAGVRLAYAGSAVALDLTETGSHGGLEVRVEYGKRQPFIEVEPVVLDRRRILEVKAEVGGCSSAEQVDRRIARVLDEAGVTDKDIAMVRVRGRLLKGVRYGSPGADLKNRAFHVRLDLQGVRPDYDLEAYRRHEPTTTEERFARTLLDRIAAATDPDEKATLERALYYGLDAFRLREVVPAYEDLGA